MTVLGNDSTVSAEQGDSYSMKPARNFQLLSHLLLTSLFGHGHGAAIMTNSCPNLVVNQEWDVGIDCTLQFVVDHEAHGWEIILTFDSPLISLACWQVAFCFYILFYCISEINFIFCIH